MTGGAVPASRHERIPRQSMESGTNDNMRRSGSAYNLFVRVPAQVQRLSARAFALRWTIAGSHDFVAFPGSEIFRKTVGVHPSWAFLEI